MDLVDIDQVLNDLEISVAADELNTSAASTSDTEKTKHKQQSANYPAAARLYGDVGHESGGGGGSGSSNGTKNFVGVSQVFNSLDVYRNNVKSLEEVKPQQYNWQQQDDDEGRKTDDEDEGDDDDDDDDDADVVGVQNSADLVKFKETKNSSNVFDDEAHSISDSLTTSSCSTFSSGPSPGNESSAADDSKVLEQNGVQEHNQEESAESAADVQNEDDQDLAQGLSTVSITTVDETQSNLPCEVTPSSVLGRVLCELSVTDVLTSESEKTDCLSTKELPINDIQREQREGLVAASAEQVKPEKLQSNAPLADESSAAPKQAQPITFCSTMDEISDTELDSMLQEMDADEVVDPCTSSNIRYSNAPAVVATTAIVENNSDQDEQSLSSDHLNADNFSQASTVEFAEIKTTKAEEAKEDIGLKCAQADEIDSNIASIESDSFSGHKANVDNEPISADTANVARPERPKTLDLNTVHALQHHNAGQTPPAVDYITRDGDTTEDSEDSGDNIPNGPAKVLEEEAVGYTDPNANVGKVPPVWVPDDMAPNCMLCNVRFTLLRRRHHCRACGKVLCANCCSQRQKLEFLREAESRMCLPCNIILMQRCEEKPSSSTREAARSQYAHEQNTSTSTSTPMRSPNPNNPMEYCSTVPPYQQVGAAQNAPPPCVIVPVGVLKKEGSVSSNSSNSSGKNGVRKRKSVMFSDGIAPGSELASDMEQQWAEAKQSRRSQQTTNNKPATPAAAVTEAQRPTESSTFGMVAQLFRGALPASAAAMVASVTEGTLEPKSNSSKDLIANAVNSQKTTNSPFSKKFSTKHIRNGCFIADDAVALPPICVANDCNNSCDFQLNEIKNDFSLVQRLCKETLKFAIRKNFYVYVKITNLICCMNRTVINFTTSGMRHVGNDEIIMLLEVKVPEKPEDMSAPLIPQDIFTQMNDIYVNAENDQPTTELSFISLRSGTFLGSRNYGGFIFIRATYQCLQDIILPENPYLIGVLIHRNEVPWAKIFPLRLILRLGAQSRYYPCPLISMQNREPVYAEIAQTIINFLADFRNYEYSLPQIHGLYIHMEDRQTTVLIPRNRHEEVIKAIDNASDHFLAFAGNFSVTADGHLVCMQNVDTNDTELYAYSTQAINIQGQPRKVTGASFFVLSEALKSTSGLSGKCSIVEDGLMVQIMPNKMEEIRNALRCQQDAEIICGPIDVKEDQAEVVSIKWTNNDREFNIGVNSPIDNMSMEGILNMRAHANFYCPNSSYMLRLTDIYIIKCEQLYNSEASVRSVCSKRISRIAEVVASGAASSLGIYLDLLAYEGSKIGLRITLDQENVCYEAGANGIKLAPQFMNALDDALVQILHKESDGIEDTLTMELVFYILFS